MCTDSDGNSLNYLKKAEVHNYDEQRRIHSITTRQKYKTAQNILSEMNDMDTAAF